MLGTLLSQQHCRNWFKLTNALAPLTLAITLLASIGKSVEAKPVVVQYSYPTTTYVYGTTISRPVVVIPSNPYPSVVSPYNYPTYNTVITPVGGVIRNTTLIHPTVIRSRISDSVLVNPVIIRSPRYGYPRTIIRQPGFIYNSPGVRVRLGY
jgi:hypothetical protein